MGPGPAPRPGPGHRIRHRRLGLQRARAAGRRLPLDDHGAAAHRPGRIRRHARPALARRLAAQKERGGADLLFVGKVSPHKGQHDLVKALAAYRRLYDPEARLHLVGGAISDEYRTAVERFADELGLLDAVEIAGSVTHEELIAYYAAADAFVCLSNHEGFCVPLLEAMYHRPPHRGLHQHGGPRDGAGCRVGPSQQGAGPGGGGHRPGGPRSQAPVDAGPGGLGAGGHLRPAPGAGRTSPRPSRQPARRDGHGDQPAWRRLR